MPKFNGCAAKWADFILEVHRLNFLVDAHQKQSCGGFMRWAWHDPGDESSRLEVVRQVSQFAGTRVILA